MHLLKSALEWTLRLAGMLAIAFAVLHFADQRARDGVVPPPGMRTIDDFRRWQPAREEATRIEANGVIYYLIRGDRGRALASGPAGYLFDARGNFVGWSRDLGDDHQVALTSDGVGKRSTVKLSEITRQ